MHFACNRAVCVSNSLNDYESNLIVIKCDCNFEKMPLSDVSTEERIEIKKNFLMEKVL